MLIYRAVNTINRKSYVGKTEQTLDKRKFDHIRNANKNKGFAFHAALRKYGEENFLWEIVDDNISDETTLNQKEEQYIALYESFGPNGYNMTKGGEGQKGWVPSDNTKATWSKQRKGKTPWNKGNKILPQPGLTDEEKSQRKKIANQKRSETLKGRTPWNAGLKENYGYTKYKVIYKDGSEKIGTRVDLTLPKSTIDTMFRDKCGSRKYNIKEISRV